MCINLIKNFSILYIYIKWWISFFISLEKASNFFGIKIPSCNEINGMSLYFSWRKGKIVSNIIDDSNSKHSYDKFDFTDGFAPVASTSHKINVLIASPLTVKTVPKISSIYYFAPGSHTEGDGYLYQDRSLSDTFVFPNGKDNKIDSIYVDVDTDTYTA